MVKIQHLHGNKAFSRARNNQNENAVVSALVTKQQVQVAEIEELMETRFDGDVPAFLAAFTKQKSLSDKQIEEIMKIIDSVKE